MDKVHVKHSPTVQTLLHPGTVAQVRVFENAQDVFQHEVIAHSVEYENAWASEKKKLEETMSTCRFPGGTTAGGSTNVG